MLMINLINSAATHRHSALPQQPKTNLELNQHAHTTLYLALLGADTHESRYSVVDKCQQDWPFSGDIGLHCVLINLPVNRYRAPLPHLLGVLVAGP